LSGNFLRITTQEKGYEWITYVNISSKEMLSSSTILLISKETGGVIYTDSSNEEG